MSEIAAVVAKLASLSKQRKNVLRDLVQVQKTCRHYSVWEVDYRDKGWLGADPPFRVCQACGYKEYGWYCGYKRLRAPSDILLVERDDNRLPRISELELMASTRYHNHGNSDAFAPDVMKALEI